MVSCYAPNLGSTEQVKDDFYDLFWDVISKIQHKDKLILTGDFNSRVDKDYHSLKGDLGHYFGHVNSSHYLKGI